MVAASDADELLARPLGYATSIIRKTIGAVTNDSVWFNIELLKNEPDLARFLNCCSVHIENESKLIRRSV